MSNPNIRRRSGEADDERGGVFYYDASRRNFGWGWVYGELSVNGRPIYPGSYTMSFAEFMRYSQVDPDFRYRFATGQYRPESPEDDDTNPFSQPEAPKSSEE